ncbi:MAG: flavodoxin family protein [Lachnospiraceae bacterium]|nr:flavodoxin family protein [Lachnospiraceae bacterium]
MKILVLNGSPRANGNTSIAVDEFVKTIEAEGVEAEVIRVGSTDIRGCVACGSCGSTGKCVFDDVVNEVAEKFKEADGLVVASPVYYASANSTLTALLDRLFYSSNFDKTMKVASSIVVARRGGASAAYDQLNKYFTGCGMVVVTSNYWNSVHGGAPGEALKDHEGMQTMRVLARNMAFLIKSIKLGKDEYGVPEKEQKVWTNFIR